MATVLQDVVDDLDAPELSALEEIAQSKGNIADWFDAQSLATIGADVVQDYEHDLADRKPWEDIVTDALEKAAQGISEIDAGLPEYRRSHVNFPIITVAAMQFHARAYPAICKSGNMVRCKVIGSDKGRQAVQAGPDGESVPLMVPIIGPDGMMALGPNGEPQMQPRWLSKPGAKAKRAERVSDYMNVYLEFRMDDWEADTDAMLMQLPIVGDGFRKLWWRDGKEHAAYVPALNVVLPKSAKNLKTTPRITEKMPDVFPYQIRQRMASGDYRTVTLPPMDEDTEAPRLLLEQHRLMDMDEDGIDEPYIVTVDCETSEVLKIEANFGPDNIRQEENGALTIDREQFFVNYPFLPDPQGGPYGIGIGHLLKQVGDIIDTTINQMFDAGHAQIAGGGFFASGLRLQGNGQTNTLRWRPGEYKSVSASGAALRDAIYERTFPGPSAIMFNLLELVLGAAKDIAAIKDVLSGEAGGANMPVGTTLALIEQGLQVFNDIYKRVYRQLGVEFGMIYSALGRFGGEAVARDYDAVLDDNDADFAKDFADRDMDIKPVADPSSVTKMQKVAKAQALLQFRGVGLNDMEINRRALEALDIEDIDDLIPEPDPSAPPPPEALKTLSEVKNNDADTEYKKAQTAQIAFEIGKQAGVSDGTPPPDSGIVANDDDAGRLPTMEGASGDGGGDAIAPPGDAQPAIPLDGDIMGAGGEQPGNVA